MAGSDLGSSERPLRYVVIGCGMAGLLAGIKLKERGDTDFTIYEKGNKVGGTWRENVYPGLTCDTPSHSYTYSFAPNPEWSAYYPPGPEIQRYFEAMTDRYGVRGHIRFSAEVTRCEWVDGRWHIQASDGSRDVADVVIAAPGVLHHPYVPDIPGLESFAGAAFHSARWDESVHLDGKRIGVIGTGSTGIQIVTALAPRASHLVHFQRTPQWIMHVEDTQYTDEDRKGFREDISRIDAVRYGPELTQWRIKFTTALVNVDAPELIEIEETCAKNLDESVRDPVLREKLRPDYRATCKRLVRSTHYYERVQSPSVTIERGAIERVEPAGVRMKDGTLHELDVLALATGFRTDQFIRPAVVKGVGGRDLDNDWAKHPKAYYAIAMPGFPNLFMLNGPTGPSGNFSLIDIAEKQWAYIDQLLDRLRSGEAARIEPTEAASEDYERRRLEAAKRTVFASGCTSWYLDAEGVPQVWPWSYPHFAEVMAKPRFEDFELTPATQPA